MFAGPLGMPSIEDRSFAASAMEPYPGGLALAPPEPGTRLRSEDRGGVMLKNTILTRELDKIGCVRGRILGIAGWGPQARDQTSSRSR